MASDNGWYGAPKWVFGRSCPLPLEERYWLLDLCQMACRTEPHEHEGIMLGPRETVVSLQFMARRWGVHKSRIRRFLAHLKATHLATPLATHPVGTRILLSDKLFPAMADTSSDTPSDTASDTKEKRSSYTEQRDELQLRVLEEPKAPSKNGGPQPYTTEFEVFWQAYPSERRLEKRATFTLWQRHLKSGVNPNDMIAGAERYAGWCRSEKTEPKHIKRPPTFLSVKGRFWEEEWARKDQRERRRL